MIADPRLLDALQLGGVSLICQSDNSSTATHRLGRGRPGREYNARYLSLLAYYGMRPGLIAVGEAHQNGDVESAHNHLVAAIDQGLMLGGSREFGTVEDYENFVAEVVCDVNALATAVPLDFQDSISPVVEGDFRLADACPQSAPRPSRRHQVALFAHPRDGLQVHPHFLFLIFGQPRRRQSLQHPALLLQALAPAPVAWLLRAGDTASTCSPPECGGSSTTRC